MWSLFYLLFYCNFIRRMSNNLLLTEKSSTNQCLKSHLNIDLAESEFTNALYCIRGTDLHGS